MSLFGRKLVLVLLGLLFLISATPVEAAWRVKVIKPVVNLRSEPATTTSVVGQVTIGTILTATEQKQGWYRVELDQNRQGWIRQDMISVVSIISSTPPTPKVTINGQQVVFDVPPLIDEQQRTIVPLRFLVEQMGSKVDWIETQQMVIIQQGSTVVKLWLNQQRAEVNGKPVDLDTKPVLRENRTMVPLRFVTETFGAQVSWETATNTVALLWGSPQQYVWVTGGAGLVNLYDGPDAANQVVTVLNLGDKLQLLSKRQNWLEVQTPSGQQGWVANELVAETELVRKIIVTGSVVNLREGPGTEFARLAQLNRGQVLAVLNQRGDWYEVVQEDGTRGWVAESLVEPHLASRSDNHPREVLLAEILGETGNLTDSQMELAPNELAAVRLLQLGNNSIIELETTGEVPVNSMLLSNPWRLVFDLDTTTLVLGVERLQGESSVVEGVRLGQFSASVARVVVDLHGFASYKVEQPVAVERGTVFRITIAPAALSDRLVILDPGHGSLQPGNWADPGAIGPSGGLQEKDVVLDITQRVGKLLLAKGAQVVYTHQGTTSLTLLERAALASKHGADIFVSIHANASVNSKLNGTATYYYASAGTVSQAERTERLALARLIQEETVRSGGLQDLGTLEASFAILRNATVPAVLVETAFISNPQEEKLLGQPAFRQKVAEGITQGITRYLTR